MYKIILSILFIYLILPARSQDTLRNIPEDAELKTPTFLYNDQNYTDYYCGYVTGVNCLGREAYAEKYYISGSGRVLGIISQLNGEIHTPSYNVKYEVFSVNQQGLPNQRLASKQVDYGSLQVDGIPFHVMLDEPVVVADSFFVSLNLLEYIHYDQPYSDTIAVFATPHIGDNAYGKNAIKVHHGGFYDFQQLTGVNLNLALFPIVDFSVTGNKQEYFQARHFRLFSPHPNPAVDHLNINYAIEKVSEVKYTILTMHGKEVRSGSFGNKEQGQHSEKLDVSNLPSGAYLITIQSDGVFLSTRFLKN